MVPLTVHPLNTSIRGGVIAALVGLTIGGCTLVGLDSSPSPGPTISLSISVQTADGTIGISRNASSLHLLLADRSGRLMETTSALDHPAQAAVHLLALGGETGRVLNSFVFGNAPSGATGVRINNPDATAGDVVDGLFVVGLRQKDLLPGAITWTFVSSDGSIVVQGQGITP